MLAGGGEGFQGVRVPKHEAYQAPQRMGFGDLRHSMLVQVASWRAAIRNTEKSFLFFLFFVFYGPLMLDVCVVFRQNPPSRQFSARESAAF